jgi:tight adherence protein B
VAVAAHRVSGPLAQELGRTAWELEMGAGTDAALERLSSRSGSQAVALIVAAMQVQRRSGGDLTRVLRGVAGALEQDRQVIEEADAATAQARFTAIVVVALPVCGIGLGALAAPDLPARMVGSAVGAGLLIIALALQLGGVLAVRRIARSWR